MVVSRRPSNENSMKPPKQAMAAKPTTIENMVMAVRRRLRKMFRTDRYTRSSMAEVLVERPPGGRVPERSIGQVQAPAGVGDDHRIVGGDHEGDRRSSRFSDANSSMIPAAVAASRFPVGSSARMIFGRQARARAIATRWRCPPESRPGGRCMWPGEPDPFQQFRRPRPAPASIRALEDERPCDVLHRGQHRDEVERLEHEPELLVSDRGECAVVASTEVHAVYSHGAGVGTVETADEVEQRALAAAGRADRGHELAGVDLEVHPAQHLQPGVCRRIRLGDRTEGDDAHGPYRSPESARARSRRSAQGPAPGARRCSSS